MHSFPESDFYLLVHDIGPEDALPLLALASDKQWNHVVDLESWARDRIEVNGVTRWLTLLMEADPQRFMRWFLQDRLGFVEFYLFHTIEVRVREHDQDPSDFGEGFFTLDQVYYVRFLKMPPALEGSAVGEEEREAFLAKFLQRLAEHDHLVYQHVLVESSHVIPAETEEEEFRWRNVRLAEKGFVPFDEAVGIYQPVTPRELASQTPKCMPRRRATIFVPFFRCRLIRCARWPQTPISAGLAARTRTGPGFDPPAVEIRQPVQPGGRSRGPRHPKTASSCAKIVAKAGGYLSIGMEWLKGPKDTKPYREGPRRR